MLNRVPSIVKNRSTQLGRRAAFAFMSRRRFEPEDALLICADPRGGSTWLAEILTRIPNTALFWEPLNIGVAPTFRNLGFRYREFIQEGTENPDVHSAFERLFSGQYLDPYVLHRTSVRTFRQADKPLVKFCRATQLLPWLTSEFLFKRKPIHLLRHPCAVVASQMRYGAWDNVDPRLSDAEILSDPLLAPHHDVVSKIDSVEERLAAFWAAVNSVALNHPERNQRWMTLSYEQLVQDPVSQVGAIQAEWSLEIAGSLSDLVIRPSATTLVSSPISSGSSNGQLAYWQKTLEKDQMYRILDMVERMGVSVYGSDPMPRL